MNKTVITIIILILLGSSVYYAMQDDVDDDAVMTETEMSDTDATVGGDDAVLEATGPVNRVVLSPVETGKTVKVDAVLTEPGYVVIYQVNSNSETEVVGNSDLLEPGTHNGITISLDRVVALEQTVVAVLHADDGDGEFEFPGLDTYLGNENDPIVSDVDVVDVPYEEEDEILQEQVETFLEAQVEAEAMEEESV